MEYHKDITKNGKPVYYRWTGRRFVRASKEQAELDIHNCQAECVDYVPNKPVDEMTDRQLKAACRNSLKWNGKVFNHQQDELDQRGIALS